MLTTFYTKVYLLSFDDIGEKISSPSFGVWRICAQTDYPGFNIPQTKETSRVFVKGPKNKDFVKVQSMKEIWRLYTWQQIVQYIEVKTMNMFYMYEEICT